MKNTTSCFLIDDDEDDFEIFKMALEEIDPSIALHYAYSGVEAMKKFNGEHQLIPSCIFIDWNMPRMNGKQCLEEIRKINRLNHVPIYIYSTSSDPRSMEEIRKLGAADFIVKPSNISSLVNILARIFDIRRFKHSYEA